MYRCENNIKMNLKITSEVVEWIQLAQDGDQWRQTANCVCSISCECDRSR